MMNFSTFTTQELPIHYPEWIERFALFNQVSQLVAEELIDQCHYNSGWQKAWRLLTSPSRCRWQFACSQGVFFMYPQVGADTLTVSKDHTMTLPKHEVGLLICLYASLRCEGLAFERGDKEATQYFQRYSESLTQIVCEAFAQSPLYIDDGLSLEVLKAIGDA